MPDPWTPDQTDYLRALWAEGHSASECAKRINDRFRTSFTRSACIGKVHRLGLSGRTATSRATPKPHRRRTSAPRITATPQARSNPTRPPAERAAPEPDRPYRVDPVTAAELMRGDHDPDFIGPPFRMTVRAMPLHGACRWPIGDPREPGFHFCGRHADPGHPYCDFHTGAAYQPPNPGRRKSHRSDAALQRASAA